MNETPRKGRPLKPYNANSKLEESGARDRSKGRHPKSKDDLRRFACGRSDEKRDLELRCFICDKPGHEELLEDKYDLCIGDSDTQREEQRQG